jgi:hypothetical protein
MNFNDKKIVGKELIHDEQGDVLKIMKEIGGFNHLFKENNISLTKESITRWLKGVY